MEMKSADICNHLTHINWPLTRWFCSTNSLCWTCACAKLSTSEEEFNNEPNHTKLPKRYLNSISELLNVQNRKVSLRKAQLLWGWTCEMTYLGLERLTLRKQKHFNQCCKTISIIKATEFLQSWNTQDSNNEKQNQSSYLILSYYSYTHTLSWESKFYKQLKNANISSYSNIQCTLLPTLLQSWRVGTRLTAHSTLLESSINTQLLPCVTLAFYHRNTHSGACLHPWHCLTATSTNYLTFKLLKTYFQLLTLSDGRKLKFLPTIYLFWIWPFCNQNLKTGVGFFSPLPAQLNKMDQTVPKRSWWSSSGETFSFLTES